MTTVRRVLSLVLVVVAALAVFAGGWLVGRLGIGSIVDPASLTAVERQFADRMRNVTMVGTFSAFPIDMRSSASTRWGPISGGSTRR